MGENNDALWLYEPETSRYEGARLDFGKYVINTPLQYESVLPNKRQTLEDLYAQYGRGGSMAPSSGNTPLPPELLPTKEKPQMETDSDMINAAVREAIAKPRREAEIAKRVAAVEAIGVEDNHEIGTVLRWKRKECKVVSTYVAVKIFEDRWFSTGGQGINNTGYTQVRTWEALTEWMTTGENLVEELEIAASWTTIL